MQPTHSLAGKGDGRAANGEAMLEENVEDSSQEQQVRRVLERYCRAIDRLDRELLASCYWPEAEDDHGRFTGPVRNFIDGVIPLLRERYESTMHVLGQSMIDVIDERAYAETYNIAYHRGVEDGVSTLVTVGNRYVDVLERRNGQWRILNRKVVIEWSKVDKDVVASHRIEDFPRAYRDERDPSYERNVPV